MFKGKPKGPWHETCNDTTEQPNQFLEKSMTAINNFMQLNTSCVLGSSRHSCMMLRDTMLHNVRSKPRYCTYMVCEGTKQE